jgi:hypothetical protein
MPQARAAVSVTVLEANRQSEEVPLVFDFDADAENLANYFVLWVPKLIELQALERSVRTLQPALALQWPAMMMKYGIPRRARPPTIGRGCIISSSEYLTLGFEASFNGLGDRSLAPLVCIQIAENARVWWRSWPKASATWRCRVVDFAAIAIHLTRIYVGLTVTIPAKVHQQVQEDYVAVPTPPISRLLR